MLVDVQEDEGIFEGDLVFEVIEALFLYRGDVQDVDNESIDDQFLMGYLEHFALGFGKVFLYVLNVSENAN